MGTTPTQVLAFPNIRAIVRDNGTAEVVVAGNSRVVPAGDSVQDLRNNALALVVGEAQTLKRPVRVRIEDPEGHGELIVHPDNRIESVSYEARPARRRTEAPETTPGTVAPTVIDTVPAPAPVAETVPVPANPEPQTAVVAGEAPARRSLKETSFLVSAPVLEPATRGWRGALTRLGFRMDPSAEELSEREDVRTVSQHWPGPRTIAVVNRKGGANKTPTVVMLSAILARYSGAATVAWDNNESQGTLGWRTEKGAHDRSVLDLIDSSQTLLSPSTNAAEIAKFVHHQTADKFDVLRSDENEEGDHEVTAEEVDIAHQVLTRYYRLVVMDSGNTARAANWRRMIDHTDQLVVPVTAIEDRAEAARLTLQTLESRGGHDAELARNAVVIVSESTDAKRSMSGDALKRTKDEARRIADGFAPFVRAVVRIPYDPALVNGPVRYEALQPATRRAWLAAAAAVATGF
jgi:MinD-like ATPase involved in chromosome partitioning or flagellar assembly